MSDDISRELISPAEAADLAYRRAIEALSGGGVPTGSTGRRTLDQGGEFVAGVIVCAGEDQRALYHTLVQVAQQLLAQGIAQSNRQRVTH